MASINGRGFKIYAFFSSSMVLTISSSTFIAVMQLTPLLLLQVEDFGYYSIIQLLTVLGSSASLALINEADSRRIRRGYNEGFWKDFISISFWLSFCFALIAAAIAFVSEPLNSFSIFWGLGVGFSVYRNSVRYRLTQHHNYKKLISGDFVSVVAVIICGFSLHLHNDAIWSLNSILILWLSGYSVSLLFTKAPSSLSLKRTFRWLREHKNDISTLLPDSALQDVGSFWAPALIGTILDIRSLGIYRGVTTAAAPVRLILTPLRPLFAKTTPGETVKLRSFLKIVGAATALAILVYILLKIVNSLNTDLGVISALSDFAIPISLYIAGNFLTYFYSIQGRINLNARTLITTRIVQSISLGLFPVLMAYFFELPGAIWALASSSVALGLVWYASLRISESHKQ